MDWWLSGKISSTERKKKLLAALYASYIEPRLPLSRIGRQRQKRQYEDSDDEEEYKEPQQRSDIQNKCISALGLISCRSDIQNERVNMRTLTMRRNTKKPQYRSDIQDEGKAYQTGLILPADTMGRGLNRERMKWR